MQAMGQSSKLEREQMVKQQIEARRIRDRALIEAMREVPRELFVSDELREFAYYDVALPTLEEQTISQPYMVALMLEALDISPEERVLEVGTGSGYAAAILSRMAREVYTVERIEALAEYARERLEKLACGNVYLGHGDGTLGWEEHAPYDAIVVAAGGPEVPKSLREQLALGGRLVIPVGSDPTMQTLVRVMRVDEDEYAEEDLGPVRFVPLVGAEGWGGDGDGKSNGRGGRGRPVSILVPAGKVSRLIREAAEPFARLEDADLGPLMERVKGCRVVLIGEATHGTAEFYRMRQRITQELIQKHGFTIVSAEADWPDASRVNAYARNRQGRPRRVIDAFNRFPLWMWRNHEVLEFVEWLRVYNEASDNAVGFYGLDLYSLHASIYEVLHYLEEVDPETATLARARYGCLTPFESDPATYGHAALTGRYRSCEDDVVRMLRELAEKRMAYAREDGERFFDAEQNARVAASAERYYRAMYYGSAESWNLRDRHMFETLEALLRFHGPGSKAVVWAHNSHIGNAAATEMALRGETNLGNLAREKFGDEAYLVGFGTDHGTVAAASNWGEEVEIKQVRPSHPDSYERLCHDTGVGAFFLSLREPGREVREELLEPRLERAIGVIYRPETELLSHYFQVRLPLQFDEYIWFDESSAVRPIGRPHAPALPQAHPFALLDE